MGVECHSQGESLKLTHNCHRPPPADRPIASLAFHAGGEVVAVASGHKVSAQSREKEGVCLGLISYFMKEKGLCVPAVSMSLPPGFRCKHIWLPVMLAGDANTGGMIWWYSLLSKFLPIKSVGLGVFGNRFTAQQLQGGC